MNRLAWMREIRKEVSSGYHLFIFLNLYSNWSYDGDTLDIQMGIYVNDVTAGLKESFIFENWSEKYCHLTQLMSSRIH